MVSQDYVTDDSCVQNKTNQDGQPSIIFTVSASNGVHSRTTSNAQSDGFDTAKFENSFKDKENV